MLSNFCVWNNSSQEFTHRVKSISMANFSAEGVSALQEVGNEVYFDIHLQLMYWLFFFFLFVSPSCIYLWQITKPAKGYIQFAYGASCLRYMGTFSNSKERDILEQIVMELLMILLISRLSFLLLMLWTCVLCSISAWKWIACFAWPPFLFYCLLCNWLFNISEVYSIFAAYFLSFSWVFC